MGEAKNAALRVDFERSLKLKFHGSKITRDAVLLSYRNFVCRKSGQVRFFNDFLSLDRPTAIEKSIISYIYLSKR